MTAIETHAPTHTTPARQFLGTYGPELRSLGVGSVLLLGPHTVLMQDFAANETPHMMSQTLRDSVDGVRLVYDANLPSEKSKLDDLASFATRLPGMQGYVLPNEQNRSVPSGSVGLLTASQRRADHLRPLLRDSFSGADTERDHYLQFYVPAEVDQPTQPR